MEVNMSKVQIEKDLSLHMEEKIKDAVSTYVALCDAMDIPMRSAIPGALASLLHLTAGMAAKFSKMTPADFGQVCEDAFAKSYESYKERRHDRGE
jgi:hypothetical protein